MNRAIAALCAAIPLITSASAAAAQVVRTGEGFIATTVSVPAGSDLVYVSGALPSPVDAAQPTVFGSTEVQTRSVLGKLKATLEGQGLSMADVVMMRVYLTADPAKGGAMDFQGMMNAYKEFFGTPAQPNKPARATVQVAALVIPTALVEIEVTAARAPSATRSR